MNTGKPNFRRRRNSNQKGTTEGKAPNSGQSRPGEKSGDKTTGYQGKKFNKNHSNGGASKPPHRGHRRPFFKHSPSGSGDQYILRHTPNKTVKLSEQMRKHHLAPAWIELQEKREALQTKLQLIQFRLSFGYSDALQAYYLELVKEELGYSCALNALLCQASSQI